MGRHDERELSDQRSIQGRRPLRSRHTVWATVAADWLVRLGVQPDQISVASIGFAVLTTLALILAGRAAVGARAALLVAAALAVQLRLLANLLDEMVAIEGGRTRSVDVFNEVPDRGSDVVILVAAECGAPRWPWPSAVRWGTHSSRTGRAVVPLSLPCSAVLALLAGCAIVESHDYPVTWPAPVDARDCALVLGTYENEGTDEAGTRGDSLFWMLRLSGTANRRGERITLSMPEKDVLEVRGLVDSRRYRLEDGTVRCRDGSLEFRNAKTDFSEGVCLRGSQTVVLSRAADSALVVKEVDVAAGLFGGLPVYFRATKWYRFQRVD